MGKSEKILLIFPSFFFMQQNSKLTETSEKQKVDTYVGEQ